MRTHLITAICVLFCPALTYAQIGHPDTISGRWTGYWTNSHGSEGHDQLKVWENAAGEIRGHWGEYGYPIRGARAGPSQYVWEAWGEGKHQNRHYRARAALSPDGRFLRVRYSVVVREYGERRRYWGRSRLRRVPSWH